MKEIDNVAIIVRCLYDYRIPLYDELATRRKGKITVFHSSKDLQDHSKSALEEELAYANYIKGYQITKGNIKIIIQPSVLSIALSKNYSVIVCLYGKSQIINFLALFVSKFITKKRFIWWTGGWEPSVYPGIDMLLRRFSDFMWRIADGVIVYHSEARDKLVNAGVSKDNIFVAQNTRDDRNIVNSWDNIVQNARNLRKRLHINDSDKVILFVGALIKRKNVELLIQAFNEIIKQKPNTFLVIVGDGSERSVLEKMVSDLCIPNVLFEGGKTDDVHDYFCMSDVFVLPGLGGLAINDAMVCRKPVITGYADGSERDLVIDGVTGYLLPEGDGKQSTLLKRILDILNNRELQIEMGEKAFTHYISTASFEKMVDEFEKAIHA